MKLVQEFSVSKKFDMACFKQIHYRELELPFMAGDKLIVAHGIVLFKGL